MGRPLSQHETTAEDRSIVIFLLLARFSSLALFVVLSQRFDGGCLLTHVADHERHGEVVQAMAPRNFHDDVKWNEIVTGVEHSDIAFPAADVDELVQQLVEP